MLQAPAAKKHAKQNKQKTPLKVTVVLAFLSLLPLADLSLELKLAGEEHLSPAHVLGQGPQVRGDVTGRLNYQLPQFVRPAQLQGKKSEVGHVTCGLSASRALTHEITPQVLMPGRHGRKHCVHRGVRGTAPASGNLLRGKRQVHRYLKDKAICD